MKKLYYRLEELQERHGISSYDVRYLMERDQLPICFYRPHNYFIYGTKHENRFTAHGHVAYAGLVELERMHNDFLLALGYTETNSCFLLEQDNMDSLGTECPGALTPPNQYFSGWQPKKIEDLISDPLFAMENNTAERVENDFPKPEFGYLYPLEGQDASIHINIPFYKYSLSDLVIQHKTLVELGLFNKKTEKSLAKNAFRTFIEHLIKIYPSHKASGLWKILNEIWDKDDDIDPESILVEVNESFLIWANSNNVENRISYKTFQNRVSELRNNF